MKSLYDQLSIDCSKKVTTSYSTSFSLATRMLAPSIRPAIHAIYGFVRLADEIVDSFHGYEKEKLLTKFEEDYHHALEHRISLNPILHSFQQTVHTYKIDLELIDAFLYSMKMDLVKSDYKSVQEYTKYIYGSAEVVGLMCLKVFVNGDQKKYNELKDSAKHLGAAFQKVNFLRDLKSDIELLNRSYFPNVDLKNLDPEAKKAIIQEIDADFKEAFAGIVRLPSTSKFGVYTAYVYYKQLLNKLKSTPSVKIMDSRIRVKNHIKFGLLLKSYAQVKLNLL